MPRVLVSDKLSEEGLRVLEAAPGIEVDHRPGMEPDALREALPGYDALIIRSGTKVTKELIEAAGSLRVVGRAGIGVDNVDLAAATARGIIVMNTPEGNAITTAEHAVSLLLSLARKVPQATSSMKAGRWDKSKFSGKELFNQTLGVIGLGNIGSIVADRARGLRMRVIAFDPLVSEERAQRLGVDLVSLDELYERADAITVHVPLTKDTRGLIGAEAFSKMKSGVLIVNAARGGIVDEKALLQAIESGRVAGAALDVFEDEPPPADHPLLSRDEVIATPHLGAATAQAQLNVAIAVAEQVRDYLIDGVVRNAVNMPSVSADQLQELRRRAAGHPLDPEGPARALDRRARELRERTGARPESRDPRDRVEGGRTPGLGQPDHGPHPDAGGGVHGRRESVRAHAAPHRASRRLPARGDSRGADAADRERRPAGRCGPRRNAAREREDQHLAHAARAAPGQATRRSAPERRADAAPRGARAAAGPRRDRAGPAPRPGCPGELSHAERRLHRRAVGR
jgi:phosphoglycerate dehydrogenase-like enzyme